MNDKSRNTQLSVRVDRDVADRADELARWLGLTRSGILRAAFDWFDTSATLRYLETADALDEVGDPGAITVARKRVAADLTDLEEGLFGRKRLTWNGK